MTRIIAGVAGSLRLNVPKDGTRPTSDRVREAIFSSLESWGRLRASRVLDLYAGSGALGLEAASRGATDIVLVEKHAPAAQLAQGNATTVMQAFPIEQQPRVRVLRSSVRSYLEAATRETATAPRFDVIMLDPPYQLSEAALASDLSALIPLLAASGIVLVERSARSPEPSWPNALTRSREKRYGETVLWWATLTSEATEND